jgi:glucan phosphoethanolaminetransferase (alkaline phosphatase superfamily)
MQNVGRLEGIFSVTAMCILIALALFMLIDIHDFYSDKETYANVYQMNTSKKNWEWQYLKQWIYIGAWVVVGSSVIALRFTRPRNRNIRKATWTFLIFFFFAMILGIYRLLTTDFDH